MQKPIEESKSLKHSVRRSTAWKTTLANRESNARRIAAPARWFLK